MTRWFNIFKNINSNVNVVILYSEDDVENLHDKNKCL